MLRASEKNAKSVTTSRELARRSIAAIYISAQIYISAPSFGGAHEAERLGGRLGAIGFVRSDFRPPDKRPSKFFFVPASPEQGARDVRSAASKGQICPVTGRCEVPCHPPSLPSLLSLSDTTQDIRFLCSPSLAPSLCSLIPSPSLLCPLKPQSPLCSTTQARVVEQRGD